MKKRRREKRFQGERDKIEYMGEESGIERDKQTLGAEVTVRCVTVSWIFQVEDVVRLVRIPLCVIINSSRDERGPKQRSKKLNICAENQVERHSKNA